MSVAAKHARLMPSLDEPCPCDTCELHQRCAEKLEACNAYLAFLNNEVWSLRSRIPSRSAYLVAMGNLNAKPRQSLHFGEVMRAERRRLGLSQPAFAEHLKRLGVKVRVEQLYNIEYGRKRPSPELLAALHGALGLEVTR